MEYSDLGDISVKVTSNEMDLFKKLVERLFVTQTDSEGCIPVLKLLFKMLGNKLNLSASMITDLFRKFYKKNGINSFISPSSLSKKRIIRQGIVYKG